MNKLNKRLLKLSKYCLSLASQLDIDITSAIEDKIIQSKTGDDKLITNQFKDILNNYLESKSTGRFNKNHDMFKLINYRTTDALNEIVKKYGLSARGSCGAGMWTRYPWIAAYNEENDG